MRSPTDRTRDRTRRLQYLTELLLDACDLRRVLSVLASSGREALDAECGLAWLTREDGTLALEAAEYGPGVELEPIDVIPTSAASPIREVVSSGQLLVLHALDTGKHGQSSTVLTRSARLSARVIFPIAVRRKTIGAVSFSFSERRSIGKGECELLTSMIGQASLALERCLLFETEQRAREDTAAALRQMRLAERRKDEFLAMLSHELRNPLAPIVTALRLMDLSAASDSKERRVIERQVEHLTRLVDDLLDVSRITRGTIRLNKQVSELGAVLTRAIDSASPLLEERMQRLELEVPRAGLLIDADPSRLVQVFHNLLTNASKYSDPHAVLSIDARAEPGLVSIRVRDRGMGISPELLPGIFELFVQGPRSLDRTQGGLGIGLAVAKSLCELHGGTIQAASDGPGKGSTFTVRLPRAERPAPRVASLAPEPPSAKSSRRLLIVDDNVDAAQMLDELLSALGHETVVAHDGVRALELASSFEPSIAVLDIGLPVMDGYELARRLRELPGAIGLRLIAVTGYGEESDRQRAHDAGFDHHLVKPVMIETLLSLLA